MEGIGASPGYAVAKVFIKKAFKEPVFSKIENVMEAFDQLDMAIIEADQRIKILMEKTKLEIGEKEGDVFKAHLMMLHDPELINPIKEKIKKEICNPAYAVLVVRNELMAIFEAMDNAYMRERKADVKDVCDRVIKLLMGINDDILSSDEPVILVAHDLTPSDTASIKKSTVAGFITEVGGKTSHSAIMARSLEIPAVLGVEGIMGQIKNGQIIALDGFTGNLVMDPEESMVLAYSNKIRAYHEEKEALKVYMNCPSVTEDGHRVELACNIGRPEETENVILNDGEGIGLFRSEFLYMDRDQMPSEEEQFIAYKEVLQSMKDKTVVIRTLDVGGDKQLSYLDFPKEENPFLGFRAIRFCLANEAIFKVQLRALLRASVYGNLNIMFPMISNIREIRKAKSLIEAVKASLTEEHIPYGNFKIGIMIEIPAAALIADQLAKEVDFFSIGTNDLIQYTTAVDRMNQRIADLYSPYHPGLLKLIKMVVDAGKRNDIWVGMCGEVAGDEKLIPFLIAIGLDEFSMSPSSILKSRKLIKQLNFKSLQEHVDKILNAEDTYEVLALLDQYFVPPQ